MRQALLGQVTEQVVVCATAQATKNECAGVEGELAYSTCAGGWNDACKGQDNRIYIRSGLLSAGFGAFVVQDW